MAIKNTAVEGAKPIDIHNPRYVWNVNVDPVEVGQVSAKLGVLEQMFIHLVASDEKELNLDQNAFFYGATIILGEARKVLKGVDGFYEYARKTLPRRKLTDAEEKMLQA
jgi:hypothetical protein